MHGVIKMFCLSVNSICLPYHSTLIDFILTNNVNRLIYTGVGLVLTDQIRYHCPVIGFINYPKKDSMSKSAYSAEIRSSFGTKLWMFRWRNEIDEENIALILEVIDKSLMLDCTSVIESVGGFGPKYQKQEACNFSRCINKLSAQI
jgi:hypothetical protein